MARKELRRKLFDDELQSKYAEIVDLIKRQAVAISAGPLDAATLDSELGAIEVDAVVERTLPPRKIDGPPTYRFDKTIIVSGQAVTSVLEAARIVVEELGGAVVESKKRKRPRMRPRIHHPAPPLLRATPRPPPRSPMPRAPAKVVPRPSPRPEDAYKYEQLKQVARRILCRCNAVKL